jgi:hypothetical protein
MIARLFAPLAVKILAGTTVALLLFSVLAWNKWHDWKEAARVWRMAFAAQQSAYRAAQAAAKARLDAQRQALKTDYDTFAERADNAERKVNDLVAASDRFAAANRLREPRVPAAGGAAGRAAAPGEGDGAAGDSRAGADAVVVPIDDFNLLVGNTGRLIQAHDWFKVLEAKGLAEGAEAEGGQPIR